MVLQILLIMLQSNDLSTAIPPADHSNEVIGRVLLTDQGPTGVTLGKVVRRQPRSRVRRSGGSLGEE